MATIVCYLNIAPRHILPIASFHNKGEKHKQVYETSCKLCDRGRGIFEKICKINFYTGKSFN